MTLTAYFTYGEMKVRDLHQNDYSKDGSEPSA